MKNTRVWSLSILLVLVTGLSVVNGGAILVDLGNEFSYRGVTATSPDSNGNYWNSVWSGAYYADLVDMDGSSTGVAFGFSAVSGTDSYNGPAGPTDGLTTQQIIDAVDIDAAALGNLGNKEAAADYYVSSKFELQNLNASKSYKLTFYGSHSWSDALATSVYEVYSDNTYATLVDSVSLDVQDLNSGWLHNRDTVAMLTVAPQAGNILYVKFDGYLNAMQIEEVPEPATMMLFAFGGLAAIRRRK